MSEDEINEVELSTQDLSSLTRSTVTRSQATTQSQAHQSSRSPLPMARQSGSHVAVVRRSFGVFYVVAATAVTAIAVGILVARQSDDSRGDRNAPRWQPLPDRASQIFEEEEDGAVTESRAPLRIRNEFDRSEVFEFPPGTSRQEARDKVGEILLQRAIERQSNSPPQRKRAAPTR